jgi:hypothetical protein
MARICTICARSDAGTIAEMLGSGRSARSLAALLGLSNAALLRHARNHLPRPSEPETSGRRDVPPGLDPLDELTAALRVRALAGNPADTREYRLALAAQAAARHGAAPTRDLAVEPDWIALRTIMLAALEPFPKAREAIAAALGVD